MPEDRWRSYGYEELTARVKTSLDVFWLKDKSLVDSDNLPEPDELADLLAYIISWSFARITDLRTQAQREVDP